MQPEGVSIHMGRK